MKGLSTERLQLTYEETIRSRKTTVDKEMQSA